MGNHPGHRVHLWLPDGSQFVTEASVNQGVYEWFSVNVGGEIRQLTHFGDYFRSVTIRGAQVSPDGQFLAFWLDVEPSGEEYSGQNLAVMDLETLQVTNYCIHGSVQGDASSPVWSPDSKYIAVEEYYATNARRTILVNPMGGWATWIVDENVFPVGWMITP
jgi:Tol biopolymer transport system component